MTDRPDTLAGGLLTPDSILAYWNAHVRTPFRKATMTPKRRTGLLRRITEHDDPETWREGIDRILASPFCQGDNDRGWRASFGWICERRDAIAKAAEGQYDPTFSERELAESARWRMRVGWGVSECRHETTCPDRDACLRRTALMLRRGRR